MEVLREPNVGADGKHIFTSNDKMIQMAINRCRYYIAVEGNIGQGNEVLMNDVRHGTHDLLTAVIENVREDLESFQGINNCRLLSNVLGNNGTSTYNEIMEVVEPLNANNNMKQRRSFRNANNPDHVDSPFCHRVIGVE